MPKGNVSDDMSLLKILHIGRWWFVECTIFWDPGYICNLTVQGVKLSWKERKSRAQVEMCFRMVHGEVNFWIWYWQQQDLERWGHLDWKWGKQTRKPSFEVGGRLDQVSLGSWEKAVWHLGRPRSGDYSHISACFRLLLGSSSRLVAPKDAIIGHTSRFKISGKGWDSAFQMVIQIEKSYRVVEVEIKHIFGQAIVLRQPRKYAIRPSENGEVWEVS